MNAFKQNLRPIVGAALLLTIISLGLVQSVLRNNAEAQPSSPQAYVLSATEGEHLMRNGGDIFIKADPRSGSNSLSLGTQKVPLGAGIRVHQHEMADEVLFVLEGSGFGILGDTRAPIEKGSSIFVPKGIWHGVQNPTTELLLLWAVAPPGLEAFFREVGIVPGAVPKQLTPEQVAEIARKHGIQFK